MSLQQAKNALVTSLFELSNAATDAATATVNFYKAAGIDGADAAGESLSTLGDSINGAVQSVLDSVPDVGEPKKKATRAKKAVKPKEAAKEVESADSTEEKPSSDAASEEAVSTTQKPEKPKRKRAEKDPNAPKKPLTSYLRFNLSVREQMRKERFENGQPTYPATELNQIIADRWANLGEDGKAELQKAYESEFEVYKKALEQYNKEKSEAVKGDDTKPESQPESELKPVAAKVEPKEKAPAKKVEAKSDSSSVTKEPKKKKAATKKANGESLTVADAIAAAAAEVAKTETKPEETPKKSKKRKDKEGEEKKPKKKKSE